MLLRQLRQIGSFENHITRVGWWQLQNCPTERGLATTGFTHNGQSLTATNIKTDFGNSLDHKTAADAKLDDNIATIQNDFVVVAQVRCA